MGAELIGEPAIFEAKRALRARVLAAREGLVPTVVEVASRAVMGHLLAWPAFQSAAVVLTYVAFRNEITLAALLDQFPEKLWALPRIVRHPTKELVLHSYRPEGLRRHPYGVLEPDPESPLIAPEDVELALIPGVAFDRRGFRLGYGGGYYDRLLPRLRTITVGVTYARFVLEALPHASDDWRVQQVLTEAGWGGLKDEVG